jgi:hypothetical protein
MADPLLMDRMFQRIMRGLVETGRAPHYADPVVSGWRGV